MIKVLIVDDSALVRKLLGEILSKAAGIEVVGSAADPIIAREKIKKLKPDVLTLDIEMPRMDGVTFLGNLMRLRPMPVVMISTLTEAGADITLRALELGAVDFIPKPKIDVVQGLDKYAEEIVSKVRVAASARVQAPRQSCPAVKKVTESGHGLPDAVERHSADAVLAKNSGSKHFRTTDRIIGIGASTGGTEAIKEVLGKLPPDMPGIVICQHIPAAFSAPFAARVNKGSQLVVAEAQDGQQVLSGHAYLAPGDKHLMIIRDGARYVCRLNDGPAVNRHKPAVDVLFRSLAQNAGRNAVGLMLTGMGTDGAEGMGEMKEYGSPIVVQDENSSVVWGMPGEVVKRGFADKILPLHKIANELMELSKK
ncbi:Chemotaxis response regulator protein-glutamate methylesterase CheB [hydrothermal vent metagenome]|uniref:protein-glutamate methylesterase n=1 Tax=hydrothermal vent metagenome TaxID=652676 RepID=A0A3B1AP40_9ZZZZ